jgi:hypothetical protein
VALKLSEEDLGLLRNRVYKGYKGYSPVKQYYKSDWGMGNNNYSTKEGINYGWYSTENPGYFNLESTWGSTKKPGKESELWAKIAKEIGLKKVDSENDLRQMYDYVLGYKPPAPAAPAPKPVAKSTPAPTTPTNTYQTQISQLQSTLGTTQTALDKAIADAQESTKSYQSLINNLKLGFGNQLAAAQTNYNTQTQELIKKYGLEIGGLKTNFANQFAQQASAYDTKIAQQAADFKTRFEGQEASFAERLAKQQKGFDVSMANQSIAGRAPNLQIGSSQTGSPQQGGTAGFRRRPVQFNIPAYAGLSINSGNINI